jgi:membrane protein implicated in regulation of membrane protease activity
MDILWWHWLVLAVILALAEMAIAGGFYMIFFGVAAGIVGLLSWAGWAGPVWMQVLLFSALAVGSLLFFRTRLLRWLQGNPQSPAVDSLIGDIGVIARDLAPNEVGKIELRGASWSARNASTDVLRAGQRCRVVRMDGLMLYVTAEEIR